MQYSYYMKITTELIDRYLKNQCSTEEAEFLENYIQQAGVLDELSPQEEWSLVPKNLDYHNQDKIKEKVFAFINQKNKRSYQKKVRRVVSAAAAVLIGIIGYYFPFNTSKVGPTSQITKVKVLDDQIKEISNLYYINSGNEIMHLTASDGSVISLYPHSEIKYAEDFSTLKERALYLKGKAKFHVAKDVHKPFHVHSTGVITTALGTIFTVDELESTQTQIKLFEGKIEVKAEDTNRGKTLVRTFFPNEEITLDHRDLIVLEEIKSQTVGTDRGGHFLQNTHTIQFKNISLEDVLALLVQNYDIDFQYDKAKIANKFYSGTFSNKNQVYEDIIKEINYLHHTDINYTNPNK